MTPMAWSIFSDGGGQGAAATWADDLLHKIGAPRSPGNEQFIYDWEVSEGGGGRYNPLNQGPVPGHPELTSTGPQYGGGAADYVSWAAGLAGAADYLGMASFTGIRDALRANRPAAARSALISSPWAQSHYGGGSAFSNAPLPGHKSALPGGMGSAGNGFSLTNPSTWLPSLTGGITASIGTAVKEAVIMGPLLLLGAGLIGAGIWKAAGGTRKAQAAIQTAAGALP